MVSDVVYISEERKRELKEELRELQTTKRKEIIESLEFAKSLGDLSENAEYQQAREEQAKLEEKILDIEQILKSSVIISKKPATGVVELGSEVTVQKEGIKEKRNYQIVGSEESDTGQGKISNISPLGQALLGKKKGEIVIVQNPNGVLIKYKIAQVK